MLLLEHMLFERGPARTNLVPPTHLHVLHLCNHIHLNGAEIWKTAMMKPQCLLIKNLLESKTSFPIPFAPSTKFLANSIKKTPWDQCGCTLNSLFQIWAQFIAWIISTVQTQRNFRSFKVLKFLSSA